MGIVPFRSSIQSSSLSDVSILQTTMSFNSRLPHIVCFKRSSNTLSFCFINQPLPLTARGKRLSSHKKEIKMAGSIPGWEIPPNMLPVRMPPGGEICAICQGPFTEPYQTDCGHNFCRTCILEWYQTLDTSVTDDDEEGNFPIHCPLCREVLYIAEVNVPHGLSFLYIPMLVRRSGLLDRSYTAGAGIAIGTDDAQWISNVHEAIEFLLTGPMELVDAPCLLEPTQAARDAIIFGNLFREYCLAIMDYRATEFVDPWNYVVKVLARVLLTPCRTVDVFQSLRAWLLKDIRQICDHEEGTNPLGPLRRGFLSNAIWPLWYDSPEFHGAVSFMVQYVCLRASRRHLRNWTEQVFREHQSTRQR